MLVYEKADLDVIKKGIAEELKNNPAFESAFDSKISYSLENMKYKYDRIRRRSIDVIVSEDGKNVQIREPMEFSGTTPVPHTEMRGSEINLRDDGNMEVIDTYGSLWEAKSYYQSDSPSTQVLRNADSVLFTNYMYSRYDQNGIEVARGNYAKGGWPLTNVNYDEENKFSNQLYSKGYHMPRSWDGYGLPEEPIYVSEQTSITGIHRLAGHEGIAEIITADLKPSSGFSSRRENMMRQRAYIHTEHPDRIRIDPHQIFAKSDKHMNLEPTELYSIDKYAGKTCDEIQADIEAKYPEWVKASLDDIHMSRPKITVAALKECFGIEEQRKKDSER